jgi:cell division protein FtsW
MLTLISILLTLGLVLLLSASFVVAEFNNKDPYFYFSSQLRNISYGILAGLVLFFVPYKVWIRSAWVFGLIAIAVLAFMLVPGVAKQVNGANRWLELIPFQPSEAAKLAVVIILARYFSYYGPLIKKIGYGFFGPLLLMIIFCGLILAEKDLGGAIVIAVIIILMMIAGGVRIFHFLCLSPLLLLAYELSKEYYRNRRIIGWENPWMDPLDSGYNIIHSYYAFASGGVTGVGTGQSQQKMFFLMETHTDYIFSIIGEEHGLIGIAIIGLLFLAFAWRGLMTARSAKTLSGYYLAIGMTLCVMVPALINMAVALSIIPAKGLPLPFFSYGGSSIIVSCVAVGIIMGIYNQSYDDPTTGFAAANPNKPNARRVSLSPAATEASAQ